MAAGFQLQEHPDWELTFGSATVVHTTGVNEIILSTGPPVFTERYVDSYTTR